MKLQKEWKESAEDILFILISQPMCWRRHQSTYAPKHIIRCYLAAQMLPGLMSLLSCCAQFWFAKFLCTLERYINYWKLSRSSVRHYTLTIHGDIAFVRLKALPFALSPKENSLSRQHNTSDRQMVPVTLMYQIITWCVFQEQWMENITGHSLNLIWIFDVF